ncbi:MAG: hypothetical protein IAF38_00305 [Bacteroidia bacterium]|nr:hypothetical protein [Bacteroidia bacterium]
MRKLFIAGIILSLLFIVIGILLVIFTDSGYWNNEYHDFEFIKGSGFYLEKVTPQIAFTYFFICIFMYILTFFKAASLLNITFSCLGLFLSVVMIIADWFLYIGKINMDEIGAWFSVYGFIMGAFFTVMAILQTQHLKK